MVLVSTAANMSYFDKYPGQSDFWQIKTTSDYINRLCNSNDVELKREYSPWALIGPAMTSMHSFDAQHGFLVST